jgi:hypothetical protein
MKLFDFDDLQEIIFAEREQTGKMPESVTIRQSHWNHLLKIIQMRGYMSDRHMNSGEYKYMGVKILVSDEKV